MDSPRLYDDKARARHVKAAQDVSLLAGTSGYHADRAVDESDQASNEWVEKP